MDTKEGRGCRMNWEIETDIYTLLIVSRTYTGSSAHCSVVT